MDGDQYYREYDDDDNETEARLRAKYLSDMDMMKLPSGRIASSRFAEKKRRPKQPREPEASPPSASPSTSTSTVPQASSLSPSSPNTTTSPSPTRTSPTPSPPPQQHLQQTLQTYLRAEQLQSRDHRLAARDDMGLLGITLQQHKALLATEKRARMQEAIGARANEWGGARKEKVKEGSKAKSPSQRNHKLLPR
ncbi:hypothetical protein EJ08DRAFT_645640 [Tothia fuscella]|uniref:Uncharacterized protein n=1 Tax=Tothia fuscella TaxID=1048955 RepID=A0A9P4U2W0_9PEZI|nr:hypothetical protein EJ08DRAFT_645640 [Tothia fuscella]